MVGGGSMALFLGMLWFQVCGGELVLFKEMGMEFQYKTVLQGFREGYCDHGFAITIWY